MPSLNSFGTVKREIGTVIERYEDGEIGWLGQYG